MCTIFQVYSFSHFGDTKGVPQCKSGLRDLASIPYNLLLYISSLHPMHEIQSILTNVCRIRLSRGSYQLHCAKTAEQIKMLFGVNTPWNPRNIVLDVGPDPPQRGRGTQFKFRDPPLIFGTAEVRDLKFCMHADSGVEALTKTMQQ